MFIIGSFESKIFFYVCYCNYNMIIINFYKRLIYDMIDLVVNSVRKENLISYLRVFYLY